MPRKAPSVLAWRPSRRALTALAASGAMLACATAPITPQASPQRLGSDSRTKLAVDRSLDRSPAKRSVVDGEPHARGT